MRSGGTAGRADVADHVAALDVVARMHGESRQMAVTRGVAVSMRDVDDVSVAVGPFRLHDDAIRRGADGLSDGRGDVDGVMRTWFSRKGIRAAAEAVREDASYWRDGRRGGEQKRLGYEFLLQDAEVFFQPVRPERHFVEIIAIGVFAEVRGTQSADAALTGFIERADAGDDRQFSCAFFDCMELRPQRLDGLTELLIGGLQLAIFMSQLRKLVRLRKRSEVLNREEGRQTERRGNQ